MLTLLVKLTLFLIGIPKLLIVIADRLTAPDYRVPDSMKASGVEILVFGVGAEVDVSTAQQIASSPADAFIVASFEEATSGGVVNSLAKSACRRGKCKSQLK